jgi:glycosidase
MGDSIELPDRNGVRTPMQWDESPNAGFTTGQAFTEFVKGDLDYQHVNVANQLADKNSLFHAISRMVRIRKEHPAFGRGSMEWVETDNPSLAAYTRTYQGETLLIINNLSDQEQMVSLPAEHQTWNKDLLSNSQPQMSASLTLQPYAYLWLKRM